MGAWLHSWWQQFKRPVLVTGLITVSMLVIVLIVVEVRAYGTGFGVYTIITTSKTTSGVTSPTIASTTAYQPGKTLWDWMQLLFIPVVLAVAGFWFNHRERKAAELRAENERKAAGLRAEAESEIEQQRAKAEQEIASDNQREASLQAYINEISELLIHENLGKSDEDAEVRKIARVRTLTVLRRLDGLRKGSVLQFLHESGLIDKGKRIIDLRGAHLGGANLDHADLRSADLRDADLAETYLFGAHLAGAYIIPEQLATAIEEEEVWYP